MNRDISKSQANNRRLGEKQSAGRQPDKRRVDSDRHDSKLRTAQGGRRGEQKYWFVRKSYGWGWQPSSKEGWTIVALHIALIILWADLLLRGKTDDARSVAIFVGLLMVQTALLIFIAYKKGEPLEPETATKRK